MIRSALAAAALLASTSAFAGDVYNFKIGGQSVHIEQPRNCNDTSCMVVSIPGVYEQNTKRKKPRDAAEEQVSVNRDKKETDTRPVTTEKAPAAAATAPAPQPNVATTAPAEKSLEPANGNPQASVAPPVADTASGGLAPPKVATLAPPAPAPAAASVANSPLGVWLTEEKNGKVRIEECGANLCGYSVDAKSGANGEKVLINMKPGKDKWSGKIHDPKSGSDYDSTIAMRSDNRLRVQGCAFGGMFCGGQTWTRAN